MHAIISTGNCEVAIIYGNVAIGMNRVIGGIDARGIQDERAAGQLDIRMAEMSGTELFERLIERGNSMPVIFLTGHGDVPMAVAALKNGAFDFVEKPCNDNELVDRVIEAFKLDSAQRVQAASADSVNTRINQLTARERQVMELVLSGKLNKNIADDLQISVRTVEVHRSSLFEKMSVRTAVELAQVVATSTGKTKT